MHESTKNPNRFEGYLSLLAILISIGSLVVSVRSCQVSGEALDESRRQHNENIAVDEWRRKQDAASEALKEFQKKAKLVANELKYVPFAPNSPTVLALFNEGQDEALIQKLEYTIERKQDTPNRVPEIGKGRTIPVNFTWSHYVEANRTFALPLPIPGSAPGKEWTALEVAIVEPRWKGNTYTGTLTVYYDGGKTLRIQNLELDVLDTPPVAAP